MKQVVILTCVLFYDRDLCIMKYVTVWRSTGEGNGNPLHCSCLENPVDGGAWWAAVHRVAQSQHNWSYLACVRALEIYITQRINWFKSPMHVTGHAWVKDQKTNMLKKNMISDFILQPTINKLPLVEFWYSIKEEW